MPTHSSDLSDPGGSRNPPVPADWWATIRRTMPAYDPDLTPTRGMSAIPECFRKQSGALRSGHPQSSFAARDPAAAEIVGGHSLEDSLGERSPLARIGFERRGRVASAEALLASNRALVDYAVGWIRQHRATRSNALGEG